MVQDSALLVKPEYGQEMIPDATARVRVAIEVQGAVQGVGFRPNVYRLAKAAGLSGWVRNHSGGVTIEAEGVPDNVETFLRRLQMEPPPLARMTGMQVRPRPLVGDSSFTIEESVAGKPTALLLPDMATCPDCLADIHAPGTSRFAYPFTNCTNCGPRFTIVHALPYDRAATTMAGFPLCPDCATEYHDPGDRRFHAQPTACADCGPTLSLVEWRDGWTPTAHGEDALAKAAEALLGGSIVAVKGLGGFHLMVDATDEGAVARLRRRKGREEKPLAVMVRTLDDTRQLVDLQVDEAALLTSPAAPIVLAAKVSGSPVAPSVAPNNSRLGLMLAATPLHHLLLEAVGCPLVATSGNLSDDPLCTDNEEALSRLGAPDAPIADLFLLHNRPIARHVDDSVMQVVAGSPQFLRRARGFVPLPIVLPDRSVAESDILAVGGHQKNTVALACGANVFLSQHIGDLASLEARSTFARVIADLLRLYDAHPALIAHDLHPDYASTLWAQSASMQGAPGLEAGVPLLAVQHHHAHLAACLADAGASGPALGVIWDGSGYGPDGSIWGGEFLLGDAGGFQRVAHLRPFRLAGGEAAVREPWRPALALLHEAGGPALLESAGAELATPAIRRLATRMLAHSDSGNAAGAPLTTSAGRLFDGLAALLGLRTRAGYEGQAAMLLEQAIDPDERGAYPLPLSRATGHGPRRLDWEPMLDAVIRDRAAGVAVPKMAARIHRGLSNGIAAAAVELCAAAGIEQVVLSGGCFQNRVLTEWSVGALHRSGLSVILHRQVPPNDGGIALGQVAIARAYLARRLGFGEN